MLARNAFRAATRRRLQTTPIRPQRRTLIVEHFAAAADQFIDLSLALPYPTDWPPYASTIILITVVSRLAVLPVSIWAKKKSFVIEDVLAPEFKRNMIDMKHRAQRDLKLEPGVDKMDNDAKIAWLQARIRPMMQARQKELFKALDCAPMKIMVIAGLSQLAVFLPLTFVFGAAAMPPTPLDSEAFLTLTALTHPDATYVMPIALGMVTMATADSTRWFLSPEKMLERLERDERAREAAQKRKLFKISPGSFVGSFMRSSAIFRIIIGMVAPGSVLTYWLASATFGLFQAWGLQWWARVRTRISLPVPPLTLPGRRLPTPRPA
ncbi:hypothetical protein EXIGLDRAFT_758096 [Exidia glandulosa HHB12029]|uniref:Uncharacterized protein n=1 Tax=Exidia glandulosa HHB12029 TaxID=1314781 RepID=A0A166BSZ1_EXIGL|nr:hypothetical protein EXIGLDRAFT_758096 [Exidia glandulosa HHB12029]